MACCEGSGSCGKCGAALRQAHRDPEIEVGVAVGRDAVDGETGQVGLGQRPRAVAVVGAVVERDAARHARADSGVMRTARVASVGQSLSSPS